MNKYILEEVQFLKDDIATIYDDITKEVNTSATDTYNLLSQATQDVTTIKDKIRVLGDMFTDLRVLNGTAKNLVYLSTLPIVENTGILVDKDRFKLNTLVNTVKEYSIKLSSISSVEKYNLTTLDDKRTTLDNFLRSSIETKINFENTRYTFSLNLRYDNLEQINAITLQLGLTTDSYPIINSIKYVDKDNVEKTAVILNNTSVNYDLDNREYNNEYEIDISPILTNQIMIEFTSRISSSIVMKKVETKYKKEVDKAEIIVGPVYTDKPLLKVALDCESFSEGVTFELSTDLEYWLPLDISSIITDNTDTKILSFNTINSNSIKTESDIYSFYIRLTLESSVITNDDVTTDIYRTVREDTSINYSTLSTINDNQLSAYYLKNSDFIYGKYQYVENLNYKDFDFSEVEYIEVNGNSKVLGLVSTPYSIVEDATNNNSGVGCELKLKRLPSETVLDSRSFDIGHSKIYDVYPRDIEETINVKQKENLCLTLKRKKLATAIKAPFFSAPYQIQHTSLFSSPYNITSVIDNFVWEVLGYRIDGTTVHYVAKEETNVWKSYAMVDIIEPLITSFQDEDMRLWQGFIDASLLLTGQEPYTIDVINQRIAYEAPQNVNPNYDPELGKEIRYVSYSAIANQIVSNLSSSNEGVQLHAENYINQIVNSYTNLDIDEQIIKREYLDNIFTTNKSVEELWDIDDQGVEFIDSKIVYSATSLNTYPFYESKTDFRLEDIVVASFYDEGRRQWEGFQDAALSLTGGAEWTNDPQYPQIWYAQVNHTGWTYNGQLTPLRACQLIFSDLPASSVEFVREQPDTHDTNIGYCKTYYVKGFVWAFYDASLYSAVTQYVTYVSLAQKLLTNRSEVESISIHAENYIQNIHNILTDLSVNNGILSYNQVLEQIINKKTERI